MKLSFCAVCGDTNVEYHHWIPRSLGGLDIEDNILTLCPKHHGEFHSIKRRSNHKILTKKGMERARARGAKIGAYGSELAFFNIAAKQKFAESIRGDIEEAINSVEKITYSNVCDRLNEMGVKTRQGNKFYPSTTRNVIKCLNLCHHFNKK